MAHRNGLGGGAMAIAGILLCAGVFAKAPAGAAPSAVPLIYSTDLYHPHVDLDDHFDLAEVFALPELSVQAIILDVNGNIARSGRPAVEQMMALTGRRVPYAVGLKGKLQSPQDKALDQPAACQQGVALLLRVLREAKAPMPIVTTGSVRDVVAAFNREPALFRAKVSGIYANVGNAAVGGREYNVDLDAAAYRALFASSLPVCWFPCFPADAKGATFWRLDYTPMFADGGAPVGLQDYFLYAMRKLDPAKVDPLAILKPHFRRQIAAQALPRGSKEMWSTPSLLAVAGRKVYRVGLGRWVAAASPPPDGKEEPVFRLVPARVEVDERGRATKVQHNAPDANVRAFYRDDPDLYGRAMNSCLLELYRKFAVAGASGPEGDSR
jgi:hypothetical protein